MSQQRNYQFIYMLPASLEEQVVDEFVQKFEAEVNQNTASLNSTRKSKYQMVKTSVNKGVKNVYLITSFITANSAAVSDLGKFLRLAQGTVINHLIIKEDEKTKTK